MSIDGKMGKLWYISNKILYSSQAITAKTKPSPQPLCVSLIKTQPHALLCILSTAAFTLPAVLSSSDRDMACKT